MFCAHINPITLKEQSVKEHLYNVSALSKDHGAKISLNATGELIGILHDMGKETEQFNSYIHYSSANPKDKSLKGKINHSTAGAKLIYGNFYNTTNQYEKITAQLISLAICSHHGGLIDCLDLSGMDVFNYKMNTDKEIFYEEAQSNFKNECLDMEQIKKLFNKSKAEIKSIIGKINAIPISDKKDITLKFRLFSVGFLQKYLFSSVIDADRYDTYAFMEGAEQQHKVDKPALWNELADILENKLEGYPKETKMDLLREEVSRSCRDFAKNNTGIYQLSVPTGGGKTLSSLRYAIHHAKEFSKDRILYVVPYTTIIEQNAKEIKDILGREDIVLEHHSNIIIDNAGEDYKLLTERWDSPIILTTMVQFMDTLFSGGTQAIRRLHNLANSIIIFDEIQSIPIKCISMFNSATNFLSNICNATIVLCTATQPLLGTTEMPLKLSEHSNMVPNIQEKFKEFKRVNLIDNRIIGGYSTVSLGNFVLDKMRYLKSVLIILNTKNSAKELFNELKKMNKDLPKKDKYLIFHLSTSMCPAHRMDVLKDIKSKLGNERVICISTQLIEAGVNISFECVVRSLAGLDSIAQAAGRCNRHGERKCSDVFIVNVEGENVDKLVDIKEGQECTLRVLEEFKKNPMEFDNDLLSSKAMDRYYQYYFYNRSVEMNYTLKKPNNDKTMYDLLSTNTDGVSAFRGRHDTNPNLILKQAFKTAGDKFEVIDQKTTGVIVPYQKGKEIITLINGECSLSELKTYLNRAQQYSVNLFDIDKRKLDDLDGIIELRNGGVLALREGFYKEDIGVTLEKQTMDFYNI
ncbi:CRISPR-associated helicase Cas3' [Clostridium sp. CX1]|uniref:CRISPR-associated helicase Cas3' n=1 Tax=Clostridium sp. CX1 TaxID=2978346 RepID=UPI0021C23CE9|nr:CRISPR-associated helicase Cas3' [Clostridium sp. CX1]MCT8975315.1 CRISPR-associated helicase Cas3' [Clostridium sp. CX1]